MEAWLDWWTALIGFLLVVEMEGWLWLIHLFKFYLVYILIVLYLFTKHSDHIVKVVLIMKGILGCQGCNNLLDLRFNGLICMTFL